MGPLVERADGVTQLLLGDKRSAPTDLVAAVRITRRIPEQGTRAWRALQGEDARALFTSVAAHGISPMPLVGPTAVGLMIGMLACTVG